jgi:hypothetical protein
VLGVPLGALILDVLEEDPLVAAGSEAWDGLGEYVERDPDVPGAFRFHHALIRDAAYEGSRTRGVEVHGRVAEVIERSLETVRRPQNSCPSTLQRRPRQRRSIPARRNLAEV